MEVKTGDIIWITTGQKPGYHKADRAPFIVISSDKDGTAVICPVRSQSTLPEKEVVIPKSCAVSGFARTDLSETVDLEEVMAIFAAFAGADVAEELVAVFPG